MADVNPLLRGRAGYFGFSYTLENGPLPISIALLYCAV